MPRALSSYWQGKWFVHGDKGWQQWQTGEFPAYRRIRLGSRLALRVVEETSLNALPGAELFVGYGDNPASMVSQRTWAKIYFQPN